MAKDNIKNLFLTQNQFIKKFDLNGDNKLDSNEIEQAQTLFQLVGKNNIRIGAKKFSVSDLGSIFQSQAIEDTQKSTGNTIFGNNVITSSGTQNEFNSISFSGSSGGSGGIEQLQAASAELQKTANEKGIKGFFKKIGKAISGKLKKQAKKVETAGKNIEQKESANGNKQQTKAEKSKTTAENKMSETQNLTSNAEGITSSISASGASIGGTSTVAVIAQEAASIVAQGTKGGTGGVNMAEFGSLQTGEMKALKDMGLGEAIKANGMTKLNTGKGLLSKVGSLLKVGKMISGIAKTLKALGPTLQAVAKTLKTVASAVSGIPIVGQALSAALKVIGTVIKGVAKGIKAIGKVISTIASKIGKVIGKLKKAGNKLLKSGKKLFTKGADKFSKSKLAKGKFVQKAKALLAKIKTGKNTDGSMNLLGKGKEFAANNGIKITRNGLSINGDKNSLLGELNIKASKNGLSLSLDESPFKFGYNKQQGFNTGFNYTNNNFGLNMGLNEGKTLDLEAIYEKSGFKFA